MFRVIGFAYPIILHTGKTTAAMFHFLLQDNLLPDLKYRACFPQKLLLNGNPCSRGQMCQSGFCSGGSQVGWALIKGVCAAPVGKKACIENIIYAN